MDTETLTQPRASIIITCYNYAHYVGQAIDSALAQNYPRKEVIVVNNGSTDNSAEILRGYGEKIRVIEIAENKGVIPAFNIGFAAASGEIIYYLDADDIAQPDLLSVAAPILARGDVSKVQFRLAAFDGAGKRLNSSYPNYAEGFSPEDVRRDLFQTALYPCPPTTGNIYARWFLERLMPLPTDIFDGADGAFNTVAPLYGDVVTVNAVLACNRSHGNNYWGQGQLKPQMFKVMIRHDLAREAFLRQELAKQGREGELPKGRLNDRAVLHLMYRLSSLRVLPSEHPLPEDRLGDLLLKGLRASAVAPNIRMSQRILSATWFLGVGLLPLNWAKKLIVLRFNPTTRPALLSRLLRLMRAIAADDRPRQA